MSSCMCECDSRGCGGGAEGTVKLLFGERKDPGVL